jgi:hypothetical protein
MLKSVYQKDLVYNNLYSIIIYINNVHLNGTGTTLNPQLLKASIVLVSEASHTTLSCEDDDVYLDKLQMRGVKESILYMRNVDYIQ